MTTFSSRLKAHRRAATAGLVGLLAALPGCAWFAGFGITARRDGADAMLAAARAREISMFGDIGEQRGGAYFTRAAVSLRRHTYTEIGGDSDVDVDPTGRQIVFASTRHNTNPDLYMKSVEGVAVTQLTSDPASDIQPALSPDGSRVAFASDRSGVWDIWIVDVGGGQPLRVTDSLADDVHPTWSPDGRQLAYCSMPVDGGQWELWITDAQAGSIRMFIGYGLFPEWSPTGDRILYQRARERGSHRFSIWTLTLVDGEPRYPTELASSAHEAFILPTWSPDGRHVAFSAITQQAEIPATAGPREAYDIWMMSADGRGRVRLTDGFDLNSGPAFSMDGRIFFGSNRSGHENIWSLVPTGAGAYEVDQDRVTIGPDGIVPGRTTVGGTGAGSAASAEGS